MTEPERIRPEVRDQLADHSHDLLLSAASSWEIAIKHQLGKLRLPEPPASHVPDRLRRSGVSPLPVEHTHALEVAGLPPHHRDPFDRLLIAQSSLLDLPLVTADHQLIAYDIELVLV